MAENGMLTFKFLSPLLSERLSTLENYTVASDGENKIIERE